MRRPDPETVPGTKQWHWIVRRDEELREPTSPFFTALVSASGWPCPIDIGRTDLIANLDFALDHLDARPRTGGEMLQIVDAERRAVCLAWRLPTIDKWWFSPWLRENVIPYMDRDPLTVDLLLRMSELEHIFRKDILWWQRTWKRNPNST